MFVFGLMSAHAICMLTVGSVPASLRRHIIENYALFLPGRKEKNFIIYGFLNLFNLALGGITILPKEYSIPVASGVLGGLSLATLVMLLTLRSIRRGEKGETPTEAVRETATAGKR